MGTKKLKRMTTEEAKDYFGVKFIKPNLYELMTHRFIHSRESHCKIGSEYWYFVSELCKQNNPVYKITHRTGWHKLKCIYRRSGANFLHIEGAPKTNELVFMDGSMIVDALIPAEISFKAFKINPELSFAYDDLGGMIKFVE